MSDLPSTVTRITRRNLLKGSVVSAAVLAMGLATVREGHADQTIPESHFIDNIPYHEQEDPVWCGPACTQMLLDYLGVRPLPTQKEIAHEQGRDYVQIIHGTLPNAMVDSFQSRGYSQVYTVNNLTIDKLKKLIAAEIPVNILGGFTSGWHWVVAHGYDDTRKLMIVHNPAPFNSVLAGKVLGPSRYYDYDTFDRYWTNNSSFTHLRIGVVVPYKGSTYIPIPELS